MAELKLKFALIGCGYIGKRYIAILSQLRQCQLVAIIDADSRRLNEFENSGVALFHSVEQYLNSGMATDAVIVATPNGTHAPIALACLQQNKHVLIEKPMALKRTDAEAIIETAKDRGKKVMVVLQNRFSPVSLWLKELAETKVLGRIFFVEVNCFWNRDERYYQKDSWHGTRRLDGGSLFTQFSHFVDTVYWLFGDIKNIHSRFHNFNHGKLIEFEDTGSVQFEFEQGGIGCMNFSTAVWDQSLESSITIIAENGSIKISGQYMDKIEYCHIKNYDLPAETNESLNPINNQVKMVDAFVEAIRMDEGTNAEEALYSIVIIERMYAGDRL